MSNQSLQGVSGEAMYCAYTGQIALVHAQLQLMELQLLQLLQSYAGSVDNFGMRRYVADEIGLLLGLSSRSAELMLQDAEMLLDHPAILDRVATGQWTLKHAHAALTTLLSADLDREQQDQAITLVLSQGARTPWEVRKAMQAAVLIIDPEAAASRHAKAVADRAVSMDASQQVGTLLAHGSVSQVRSLMAALEAHVGPAGPEETRNHAQRMFDALMDCVCGRAQTGQWQAYVVMTLDTLTGASDQPAEIPGLGLIPAHEARDLATSAELRRVITNHLGELVSIDSIVHHPDNPTTPAPATQETPERLLSSQTEDLTDDAEPDIDQADLAWHQAQLDQPTQADPTQADPNEADAAELHELANTIELCPEALDRALERMLQDALTHAVLGGIVPATSVTFQTDGYHHRPHYRGEDGPGPGPGPGRRPDGDPPTGGSPRGDGPPPPPPPAPPAPPAAPAGPTGTQHDPDPDVPPSPGDLAWDDETTDYRSYDTQIPPRRYQREPGTRRGGATVPTLRAWTPTGLRTALTRMHTTPLDTRPLTSVSYALPTRMARHIKTRDTTCQFPGCQRLAQSCQNDHITPWPTGRTEEPNIASECIHHHQSKTLKYFTVTKNTHGVHWTTRAGRTYTQPPRPLLRGW